MRITPSQVGVTYAKPAFSVEAGAARNLPGVSRRELEALNKDSVLSLGHSRRGGLGSHDEESKCGAGEESQAPARPVVLGPADLSHHP
jgi:hypothetical protein